MKRTLAVFLAIFVLASFVLAQSSGAAPAAAGKADAAKPASPAAASPSGSTLPSEATVNAFFHRMFGFEPNLVFKVLSIKASPVDGLAEVTAAVNTPNGQQVTKMFVEKDYAIAGELLPFGADPFARERAILNKAAFGPSQGPATPAITIVEFGDLECPACKQAQPAIEKLIRWIKSTPGRGRQPLTGIASRVKITMRPGSSLPLSMSSRKRRTSSTRAEPRG
jgi:protein-disulfide isomerase